MIANGRIDQSNRLQFIILFLRLSSILLVFPYGLYGVCWGLLLAALARVFIAHRYLHRIIDLRFADVVKACMPSALTALVTSIPTVLIAVNIEQNESTYLWVFFSAGLSSAMAWILAIRIFHHPFWDELCIVVAKFAKR